MIPGPRLAIVMHCQLLTQIRVLPKASTTWGARDSVSPVLVPCTGSFSIQAACSPKNQATRGVWVRLSHTPGQLCPEH